MNGTHSVNQLCLVEMNTEIHFDRHFSAFENDMIGKVSNDFYARFFIAFGFNVGINW